MGYDLRFKDLGSLMTMLTYSAITWGPNTAVDQRAQGTGSSFLGSRKGCG